MDAGEVAAEDPDADELDAAQEEDGDEDPQLRAHLKRPG
jgi:hypothetical protein